MAKILTLSGSFFVSTELVVVSIRTQDDAFDLSDDDSLMTVIGMDDNGDITCDSVSVCDATTKACLADSSCFSRSYNNNK